MLEKTKQRMKSKKQSEYNKVWRERHPEKWKAEYKRGNDRNARRAYTKYRAKRKAIIAEIKRLRNESGHGAVQRPTGNEQG